MIRLYILEDHSIIVDGLKQRFRHYRDDIFIAGWSNDPDEFIRQASEETFDIIILDLWFPDMDPVENLIKIQARFHDKPIVVLTSERSWYWIKVMMERGVKAYLLKDVGNKELRATLEKVSQGKTVFPDMLLQKGPVIDQNGIILPELILTPTELSIVMQLSQGALLKTMADQRFLTVSAIEKILRKIRKKVGVKTNPELIRILMEQKLL
ncbi:MAG: response regulator transcription factor [Bacteroidales bacterium]|nr:response regulator transcription factor [Bacteroidales bacterium]